MAPRVDSDRHRDVLLTLPFMVRLAVGGDQKVASRCLLILGAASASGSRAPDWMGTTVQFSSLFHLQVLIPCEHLAPKLFLSICF